MSQDHAISATPSQHRRRRFRNRSHRQGGNGQFSKFGAAMLMLLAIFLVIAGCIAALRMFE